MAKKKYPQLHKPTPLEPQQQQQQQALLNPEQSAAAAAIDQQNLSEKYSALQSLNADLVKEVVARRQEVAGLIESRDSLNHQLTRSNSVVGSLESDLARMMDGEARFAEKIGVLRKEIEALEERNERAREENEGLMKEEEDEEAEMRLKDVMSAMKEPPLMEKSEIEAAKFREVEVLVKRVRALGDQIAEERQAVAGRAAAERELLEKDLKAHVEEAESLRQLVFSAEQNARREAEMAIALRSKYEAAVEMTEIKEHTIELLRSKLEAAQERLNESNELIEGLRREAEEVGMKKVSLENERSAQSIKIKELEEESSFLKADVLLLEKRGELLRSKLAAAEMSNDEIVKKWGDLNVEFSALQQEKDDKESEFDKLLEEKLKLVESIEELTKELHIVWGMYEGLITEKDELEETKTRLEKEAAVLKGEISELRDSLSVLQMSNNDQSKKNELLVSEVGRYRDLLDVVTLEKDSTRNAVDELTRLTSELEQAKAKLESDIEFFQKEIMELSGALSTLQAANVDQVEKNKQLLSEVRLYEESLAVANGELDEARKSIDELTSVKNKLEQAKGMLENDIAGLQMEVTQLSGVLSTLQALSDHQVDNCGQLLVDVEEYKHSLSVAISERDEARKALDEVKIDREEMRKDVSELSKRMEEGEKELTSMRVTNEGLVGEKEGLEVANNKLMEEKALAETKLAETHQKLDDLRYAVKSKEAVLDNLLAMLKSTVLVESGNKNGGVGLADMVLNDDSEMVAHFTELEAIKSAFKSREAMVEEMKQEMKLLQSSVLQARKKGGFWAMVSSATTILAAIMSFAYASRVR
ncbi:hypothetical protein Dimus_021740 [Dionaea muscipula]